MVTLSAQADTSMSMCQSGGTWGFTSNRSLKNQLGVKSSRSSRGLRAIGALLEWNQRSQLTFPDDMLMVGDVIVRVNEAFSPKEITEELQRWDKERLLVIARGAMRMVGQLHYVPSSTRLALSQAGNAIRASAEEEATAGPAEDLASSSQLQP